jgi:hypothetical protein
MNTKITNSIFLLLLITAFNNGIALEVNDGRTHFGLNRCNSTLVFEWTKPAKTIASRGSNERTLLVVGAGAGYTDAVSKIVITVNSGTARAFNQACGEGIINEFEGADVNTIQIQAGTYPALVWVEGDTHPAGIVQL